MIPVCAFSMNQSVGGGNTHGGEGLELALGESKRCQYHFPV